MSFTEDDLENNFRGIVSKWFPGRHFGFIVADNGQEVFLGKHEWPESADPKINSVVEFTLGKNGKGWAAVKCIVETVPTVDFNRNFASVKATQKSSKKTVDKYLNMKLQSLKKPLKKDEHNMEGQKLVTNREDIARFGHFAPKACGISFFDPQELSTIVQALEFYRAMESWTNAPTSVVACRDLSAIFVSEMNDYKQSLNETLFTGLSVSATSSYRAKELWHVISSQPRSFSIVLDLLCDAHNTRTSKEDEMFRVCFEACIHQHADMNWVSKAAWILLHASRSQAICPDNFLHAFILVNWYLLQVVNLPFPLAFNFDAMTEETNDQLRVALTGGDEIMLAIWISKELCAQWVDFDHLVQLCVAENSAVFSTSTSIHGALKAGAYGTELVEEERKTSEEEENNSVNQSTTTTTSARDEEERIHEVIVTHRRSQRADFCFICMDDNIRPTISLLCCGQPCHIKCMEKWYASKPNFVGREKCPQCTQEIPEPTLVTHSTISNPNSSNPNNTSIAGNAHSSHNFPHYHQMHPSVHSLVVPPHQQAAYYAYQRRPPSVPEHAHQLIHIPLQSQSNYPVATVRSDQVWQDLVRLSHQQRRSSSSMSGNTPSSSSSSSSSSRRIALLNSGIPSGMGSTISIEAPLPPGHHSTTTSTATNPAPTYSVTGHHPLYQYGYSFPVVTTSATNTTATSITSSTIPSSATSVLSSAHSYYPHSGQLVFSSGEVVAINNNNGMMHRSRSSTLPPYIRAPPTSSSTVSQSNEHHNNMSTMDHIPPHSSNNVPIPFQTLFPTRQQPHPTAVSLTQLNQQRPHSNSDDHFEMLFAHNHAFAHPPTTSAVVSSSTSEPLVIPGSMPQLPPPAISTTASAAVSTAVSAHNTTASSSVHSRNPAHSTHLSSLNNNNNENISVSHLDRFLVSFPPPVPAIITSSSSSSTDVPSTSTNLDSSNISNNNTNNINNIVSSNCNINNTGTMMVLPLTPQTEEIFGPLRSGEAASSIQPSLHRVPQSPLCQHCGLALRAVECTNFHCGRCCQRVGALNCLRHHRTHVTPAGVILVEEDVSPASEEDRALAAVEEQESDTLRDEEEDIYDLRPDPELAALAPRNQVAAANNEPTST